MNEGHREQKGREKEHGRGHVEEKGVAGIDRREQQREGLELTRYEGKSV